MGNNITIPYSGHIPGGIHPGTDVVINGRVPHNASVFSINLCVGPTYQQDCALHFNPRFEQHRCIRNHMQAGVWGQEETGGGFPFHRGMPFELHMKVTQHGYKMTVNHKHLCDFHHRLPKEMVQYIYIEGDVLVHSIQFRGGHSVPTPAFPAQVPSYQPAPAYPPAPVPAYQPAPVPAYPPAQAPAYPPAQAPAYPPAQAPAYTPAGAPGPIYNPPVPFTSGIPGGVYPGKIIYISGTPNPNCQRFTLNLQCGPNPNQDVALHFDVRFNENAIVRNAKKQKQGGWGTEERAATYFPFVRNANFDVMILTEQNSFKVAVNGQHFVEFFHRVKNLQRVSHVSVTGDLRLSQIRFQ